MTPLERSCVVTTTATVTTSTIASLVGMTTSLRMDDQSKVLSETITITATSAGIGMRATHSPSPTTSTSRTTPATSVERRPRPPDFTLMTDWPIIAQPAMPPKNPATRLAMP